jgi:hypothetical protein
MEQSVESGDEEVDTKVDGRKHLGRELGPSRRTLGALGEPEAKESIRSLGGGSKLQSAAMSARFRKRR